MTEEEFAEAAEIAALKEEVDQITKSIKKEQQKANDDSWESVCSGCTPVNKLRLQSKRTLRGHIHKVNSIDFAPDNRHLVSGSLDGKLIIWDTWGEIKVQIIPLKSSWLMSTVFSPTGQYVACGGMDNLLTVYDLNNRDSSGNAKLIREMGPYDGFVCCCKFVSEKKIITGSGDMKVTTWDMETAKITLEMYGHTGDVICVSLHPDNENLCITGSMDNTAKLWDLRQNKCCQTFWGHECELNSVYYHPSGTAFVSASEDKTCRLFDIRADQAVSSFTAPPTPTNPDNETAMTSCIMSKSGQYLFAGCDDSNIHMWDLLKTTHLGFLPGHESRVTSLSLSENGMAIASASWDQNVRVWL